MSERKKVLITGAKGNIGEKLRSHLNSKGNFDLVLIDQDNRGDAEVFEADLTVYDEAWAEHFKGVDSVVHLAANPWPDKSWAEIVKPNMDMVLNVCEAAVAKRAKRFIFASSNHTMGGYMDENVNLTPDMPPKPGNPYGATKLMGERIGKSFSERHGLSAICFKIGYCKPGENHPGDDMGGDWLRGMWLSNRDLCQLMEKAIIAIDVSFAVVNAMSNNKGMKWDLSETRRILVYEPQDDAYAPEWM